MRLFRDHHVPTAITAELRRRGIDVLTAQEDGSDQLDDDLLLERARQLDRVLFSQDRDLLRIATEWLRSGRDFIGLVYAHQLSITIGQAIRDLESSLISRSTIRSRYTDLEFDR